MSGNNIQYMYVEANRYPLIKVVMGLKLGRTRQFGDERFLLREFRERDEVTRLSKGSGRSLGRGGGDTGQQVSEKSEKE
jgi:hypothetical protein